MSVVVLLLVGVLVALMLDLGALVLAVVGMASRKRSWLAWPALALSLAAIVFNFFDWKVVLQGKDTHGDPITWRDDSPLYVIAITQACVVLVAIVSCIFHASRNRR